MHLLIKISRMSNIKVTQALGGDVTEFTITHRITDTLPEYGVNLYFRHYVRKILYAAREEHGCFKFYVVCEGVFQVIVRVQMFSKQSHRLSKAQHPPKILE